VLTQMLLHPEMYEERYVQTYGTVPKSGEKSFCTVRVILKALIHGTIVLATGNATCL
jgi:hypothetical protein